MNVLYEDEWMLAVDKPAGMLVHGDGTGEPSLTEVLRGELEARGDHKAAKHLQPVQRLDVPTTGVVLFSKSKTAQPKLDALMASKEGVTKRYLAIVRGEFPWEGLVLCQRIGRDRHDARRMRVSEHGKKALTRVTRLAGTGERGARLSLVSAVIETGRKHQIRVHLSAAGYPIVGDALYGVPADRAGSGKGGHGKRAVAGAANGGLMLHALEERLTHPMTGERVVIAAPYPERFDALIERPASLE